VLPTTDENDRILDELDKTRWTAERKYRVQKFIETMIVGKVPLAAGAGSNLQRLLERGLGRSRGERTGLTNESVRARTGE